jgi:hypothetical protein
MTHDPAQTLLCTLLAIVAALATVSAAALVNCLVADLVETARLNREIRKLRKRRHELMGLEEQ